MQGSHTFWIIQFSDFFKEFPGPVPSNSSAQHCIVWNMDVSIKWCYKTDKRQALRKFTDNDKTEIWDSCGQQNKDPKIRIQSVCTHPSCRREVRWSFVAHKNISGAPRSSPCCLQKPELISAQGWARALTSDGVHANTYSLAVTVTRLQLRKKV